MGVAVRGGQGRVDVNGRVAVAVAGMLLAISLAGCGSNEYTQVCENRQTHERVDDSRCETGYGNGGYLWLYYLSRVSLPGIGQRLPSGGYERLPARGRVIVARPPAGGGVARATRAPVKVQPAPVPRYKPPPPAAPRAPAPRTR